MKITWFIIIFTRFVLSDISFSSDQLKLQFPHQIVGSGNILFTYIDAVLSADSFYYNVLSKNGGFNGAVSLKYSGAFVQANNMAIDIDNRMIIGSQNVRIISDNLNARSDRFVVKNNEVIELYDNVILERNSGQIQSDELIYNLKEKVIQSNKRVKLKYVADE